MLFPAILCVLLQAPVESDAVQSEPAAGFVEDMPDPYSPEWEPPEGPKRPRPAPPPAGSSAVPPSTTAALSPSIESVHGKRLQTTGLVFGASGVVGLLVGVYLYDEVNKTRGALVAEQKLVAAEVGSPERVEALQAELNQKRRAMIISLAAGGSAIGVGSVLLVAGGIMKQRAISPASLHLAPGPGTVGLSIKGRF